MKSNETMQMLLGWVRYDGDAAENFRFAALGYALRDQEDKKPILAPWQVEYIENVKRARRNGVSA